MSSFNYHVKIIWKNCISVIIFSVVEDGFQQIHFSFLSLSILFFIDDHSLSSFGSTWGLRSCNSCISCYVFPLLKAIFFVWQVNFCYFEAGENKQALVKLVACERWVTTRHWFCCFCHCFLWCYEFTVCFIFVFYKSPCELYVAIIFVKCLVLFWLFY